MPGTLKVRIVAARELPPMSASSQLTDAYVEVRFHSRTDQTPVAPRTINPVWNHDVRFEV